MLTILYMLFAHLFVIFLNFNWNFSLFFMLFVYPFFFFVTLTNSLMYKNYFFCLDYFSYILLILTFWVVFLSIFSSFFYINMIHSYLFLTSFFFLLMSLFLFFLSNNMLIFFFFFECSLVPILFIIMGWGMNVERLQSGLYLFYYTLFGSMPMLISIFYLNDFNNTLVFSVLDSFINENLIYFFFVLSFMIKMPLFLVHSWLPKAHVEAPVSGSMVLAGVLLKMGGYGIFRFYFIYKNFLSFNSYWIYLSIWGGLVCGFICMRQTDMKSLIAYSSVSHMSMVIMGLLVYSEVSVYGSLMLMLAHGLSSSGLFYLANVTYERSGSRSLYLNKGLITVFPSLSMWWFIFCMMNMSSPPFLNLVSEVFLFSSLVSWSNNFVYMFMLISFFGGVYNLFLYSFLNHGEIFSSLYMYNSCFIREYLIMYLHLFPVSFFFLKLDFFF